MPRGSLLTRVADDFEKVPLKELLALTGKLGRCVGKYVAKSEVGRADHFYEEDVFELWYNDDGNFCFSILIVRKNMPKAESKFYKVVLI